MEIRTSTSLLLKFAVVVLGSLLVATGVSASPAAAASEFGVGTQDLAKPADGGRYIYVAKTGTNMVKAPSGAYSSGKKYPNIRRATCLTTTNVPAWVKMEGWSFDQACPEPNSRKPLRTIEAAIEVARPGDVIVVREGTYYERLGWHAVAGTKARPIVMQAAPGENVVVRGWLQLHSAHHWTISGMRFIYDAKMTGDAEAVVAFFGGKGWTFSNNEVRDTRGVANLLVRAEPGASNYQERKEAAPKNYEIVGNCIRSQRGTDRGLDHNIYLMSSQWSTGGVIENNIIAGAPNGANIKAAGSKDPWSSPRGVTIRHNTLLNASSGIVLGLKARNITIDNNVIAQPLKSGSQHGGIKTYSMEFPASIDVGRNVINGYKSPIREQWGLPASLKLTVEKIVDWNVKYRGSLLGCNITFTKSWAANNFGHGAV